VNGLSDAVAYELCPKCSNLLDSEGSCRECGYETPFEATVAGCIGCGRGWYGPDCLDKLDAHECED
jgi:tRNA(Ile2) C34 agmatinyltransferase TiaS